MNLAVPTSGLLSVPLPTSHLLNPVKVWHCAQLKSRGAWTLLTPAEVTQNSPLSPPPGNAKKAARVRG